MLVYVCITIQQMSTCQFTMQSRMSILLLIILVNTNCYMQ